MAMASKKKTVKHWDNLVLNIKELIENVKTMGTSKFFKEPVDEVRDGAKDYYTVIKNPMDLSTMLNKLRNHQYYRPAEVLDDFKLICRNCREYNLNPENPVRKICDKFEAMVVKKWEENAQALLSCGVDLETSVFDYSLVDQSRLNTEKKNKEIESLQKSTPAFQKAPSYTDYNASSSYSTDYNNPFGVSSQPTMQRAPSQNPRQPTGYGADSGNTLNSSYNSQGSRPAQNPYGIQANPQPVQNTSYSQPPAYQPTYQPQYRPSYPKTASSQSGAGTGGSFGGSGGETSLKIDLSQLMKKTEPVKEGGDLASASTYAPYSDQTDYTNGGAYYNPASVRYDNEAAPASTAGQTSNYAQQKPYDPYQANPPKVEKNEDDRLLGALMKELGTGFGDDMDLKFENSTAASEGQKVKKDYGTVSQQKESDFLYGGPAKTDSTSFSMDFFARDEPVKTKETGGDSGYQVTLPKPGYSGSGDQAKKPQSSGSYKPEVKSDSGVVKIPKDVIKKDSDSSSARPDSSYKSSDPMKSSTGSMGSSITIKKDGSNQIRLGLENKPKNPSDKPREKSGESRPEGGEIRKEIKREPSDKIRPPGYDPAKSRDDRDKDRQPSDKRPPSSDVKRDSSGKPESSKKMEVEAPPKSSSGQNIISIKPPSNPSKMDSQKVVSMVRGESDKRPDRPDKPSSSDKPRSDRPPGSSGLSSSSQTGEKKDKDKTSSGGLSLGSRSGSDKSVFPAPANKKMEVESEKGSIKKPGSGEVKEVKKSGMEVEKKRPVENGTKPMDDKDDKDLDFTDLIAEYMSLNKEERPILKFNEDVSPDGEGESSNKMEESFEKDKDEIKPPKVSIKRDKERDKDREKKSSSLVPGSDRERPEDGKKKSGSNKSKSRTDELDDGEFLYTESHHKEDPSSSRIRFDMQTIKKEYEAFARKKVPKYIKKFQKHIKRLGSFFSDLEIQDEVLVKLKEEVEHLNLTDRSLNYSRVLLYLFNVLVFLKYQHEMNKQKFSKKVVRRMINVVKKSFAYLKEVLKLQYIKFSDEETDAFDKNAKEYRTALHAQVKQFRDFKSGLQPPTLQSKQSRHEVHSIDTGVLTGEMPRKITIIQSGDGEPKVSHKSSHHGKKDTSMKVKILPPQTKKQPKVESAPKEETEEDRIKKEMSKFLTDIRNEFEAKNYVEAIDKNVHKSWKTSEEAGVEKAVEVEKKLMQEETQSAAEASHMEVEKETADESDNIFPTTTSPISFSLAPVEKKNKMFMGATRGFERRPSPKRPSAFKFEEEKPVMEGPLWRPQPSLFQRDRQIDVYNVRYAPGLKYIDGSLKMHLKNSFLSKGSPVDKKVSFMFMTNKIDDNIKVALQKKNYDFRLDSSAHHDLFLNKLVWIKVDLKQIKDRNYHISERQDTITVSVKNPMAIEAFDKMQHLEDERIKNEIRIKDYDVLLPLAHIKEIMQENEFIAKLSHGKWRFKENLALLHNCETREDDKAIACSVNLLVLIEDFFEFKLEVNQTPIL